MRVILGIIGMEAESTSGVAEQEHEYVLYAKIADFSMLRNASGKERHEQWEIRLNKNAVKGRIRVRKTIDAQGTHYVQTIKLKNDQVVEGSAPNQDTSIPVECTQASFEAIRSLADTGMVKDRYFFPIPGTGLIWEVDVFPDAAGNYNHWVKIDLEVPVGQKFTTFPTLPTGFSEIISNPRDKQTPEEAAKIVELYDKVFTQKTRP
jgi:CYTH domain-containing protein